VISGKTAHDVRADGVLPDFDLKEAGSDYIHHHLADADYYFVSNQHKLRLSGSNAPSARVKTTGDM
jgi:hypothetical protein